MTSTDSTYAKVLVQVPVHEPDPDDPNEDINAAREMGARATKEAGLALGKRAKQVVVGVVLLIVVAIGVNLLYTYELGKQAITEAVAIANADRLSGVAQAQAYDAGTDAAAANAQLTAAGLPPVTIPGPGQGPPSDTINASAAAWALTYVDPAAVRTGDLRVIRPALDRYFAVHPVVTASGPIRNRVAGTMLVYIQLASADMTPTTTAAAPR